VEGKKSLLSEEKGKVAERIKNLSGEEEKNLKTNVPTERRGKGKGRDSLRMILRSLRKALDAFSSSSRNKAGGRGKGRSFICWEKKERGEKKGEEKGKMAPVALSKVD